MTLKLELGVPFCDNTHSMSVKIRLALTGKTHQISYRLVAQDARAKRDGKFLEILGYFNPGLKENQSRIDKDRIKYYISKGATFTPSAKHLFDKGTLPPKPKKERAKKEVAQPAPPQEEVKTVTEETPVSTSSEATNQNTQAQETQTEPAKAAESQEPTESPAQEKEASSETAAQTEEEAGQTS